VKWSNDPYLVRTLSSVIVILLAVAVFTVATAENGLPLGNYDNGIGDSWPANHRDLTIVDRTGSSAWHQAIEDAIATWNAGGSALSFSLVTESGPCAQQHDHIEYCQATANQIAQVGSDGDQGLFIPWVTNHHTYKSAILLLCSNCDLTENRMIIIATHEMGHSLGLPHNPDPSSCMYFAGGSTQPDAVDYDILRVLDGAAPRPRDT
jgi:predicted Zn-dependent protease